MVSETTNEIHLPEKEQRLSAASISKEPHDCTKAKQYYCCTVARTVHFLYSVSAYTNEMHYLSKVATPTC